VEDGSGDYDEEQWDMIKSDDMAQGASPLTESQDAKSQYSHKTDGNTSGFSSQSSLSMISRVSSAVSNNQQYPISFNAKLNTAGLFNAVRILTNIVKKMDKQTS